MEHFKGLYVESCRTDGESSESLFLSTDTRSER